MVAQLFQKTPALHVLLRCRRVRCQHEKFAAPNIQIEERRELLLAISRMDRLVLPGSKQEFPWHSTKTTNKQLKNKILITLMTLSASVPTHGHGSRGSGHLHSPETIAVIGALDANHDGVVDATEIANAPVALKSLDKNGDGKLTPDELIGPRPKGMRPGGPGAGPGPDHGDESQPTPPQQQ